MQFLEVLVIVFLFTFTDKSTCVVGFELIVCDLECLDIDLVMLNLLYSEDIDTYETI